MSLWSHAYTVRFRTMFNISQLIARFLRFYKSTLALIFIVLVGFSLFFSASASAADPRASHASGTVSAGLSAWTSTSVGSSCSSASCHGAVVAGASPTTNGTFGYSSGAYSTYADNPTNLANNAQNIGVPGGMPQANATFALNNKFDLSAYLASFKTPVLATLTNITVAPGAAYPSRQIAPASGQDYLVDTTTYGQTGLPLSGTSGSTLTFATGVVSGNVPSTLVNPASYSVVFTASNGALSGTSSYTLTVQARLAINGFSLPALAVGGTTTATASFSDSSGVPVVFTTQTPSTCTATGTNGTTITATHVGTCTIAANRTGTGNYLSATQVTSTITVTQGAQTISFGGAPTVSVGSLGTGSVTATASSGLAVTYSTVSPTCTVNASSGLVTGLSVGSCTIRANQAGNTDYAAAPQATQPITIAQGSQNINFTVVPSVSVGGTGTISASSTSGLTVTYSSLTSSCSVNPSSGSVTGITGGSNNCTIAADQAGDSNYLAATQKTQVLTIGAGSQTITFGSLPSVSVGALGTGSVSATASSGLSVSYQSNTPATCSVNASSGLVTGILAGSANCTIQASQAGNASYSSASQTQVLSIALGSQTISFGGAPSVTVGGTGTISAAATSGLDVSYSTNTPSACIVNSINGSVTGLQGGTNNCVIAADQTGSSNYNPAPQITQALSIGAGTQSISFGSMPSVAVGGTGTVVATASSGLAVTYTSTTQTTCSVDAISGSVTGKLAGSNNCTIAANQAGSVSYTAAPQMTQVLSIGIGSQTIVFGSPPTIVEGGTGLVSATGGASGNAVTFTSLTTSVCGVSGNTVTSITTGLCTVAADQLGNANYAAATQATQDITIGSAPAIAGAATFTVKVNTPTVLDLTPFATGSSITGVSVTSAPTHGAVSVNGKKVTYTPVSDFFGADAFSYVAFGTLGTSAPGIVTVKVVGRPDPRRNANVMSTLSSQNDTVKRFARAQVNNFEQRTQLLHSYRNNGNDTNGSFAGFEQGLNSSSNATTAKVNAISKALSAPATLDEKSAAALVVAYQDQLNTNNSADINDSSAKLAGLGNTLLSVLSTQSVNLASLSNTDANGERSLDSVEMWMMGNVNFGVRENDDGGVLSSFRTNGVTIGVDKRFSKNLVIGAGLGYAREKTDISDDGSNSVANGVSAAVYASYMPTKNIFIDGLLGYGVVDFDSERFVDSANGFAKLNRKGKQVFSSLTAGYEFKEKGVLFSPYARINYEHNSLDSATEKGVGLNALHFSNQDADTGQLSVGFRAEATHQIDNGLAIPHARIELQGNLDRSGSSTIYYADQLNTSGFNVSSTSNSSRGILIGFGNDFILNNGLKLSFEYLTLRSEGDDNSQSINFKLAKELGGPETSQQVSEADIAMTRLGVRVDAGYSYDDNVTRAELAKDQETDNIYSIRLSKGWNIPVSAHARIVINGFVGGERFEKYRGLENVSAGIQGELQFRPSGDYTAPTLGLFAKTSIEEFESRMRDGSRYSAGISLRKPLTDRINFFSALSYNLRDTKSEVFDTEDTSARVNIDYMLTKKSTMYLSGEYRFGDTLSSGSPSLKNADLALSGALESDDVFTNAQLTDYRFVGHSYLTTIGFNVPIGPMDSLDFSWRRVQSSPDDEPSYVNGTTKYIVNQYSIVYLVRF